MNLEDLLGSSFPKPGDADKIRALFEEDIQAHTDTLGVSAAREKASVKLTYPIAIFAWQKLVDVESENRLDSGACVQSLIQVSEQSPRGLRSPRSAE